MSKTTDVKEEIKNTADEPTKEEVNEEVKQLEEKQKNIKKLARAEKNLRDLQRAGLYLLLLVLLFYVLFTYVIGIATVKSNDMEPRVDLGDLVLYFRLEKDIRTRDIIIYEKDGKEYVSRIVAQNGDEVEISDGESLYINGNAVYEQNIFYSTPRYENDVVSYPLTVGDDEFFVLGDRRRGAEDSRTFGVVRRSEIKGVVITIIRRNNL